LQMERRLNVLCRKHRHLEERSKYSRAFRLPLRHAVGERAGERWCSGFKGRSFLQSILNVEYPMNPTRAFTLIELLVVIAISGILAALLFPAINGVKSRAKRTTCLNDLRQINFGVRLYSDDASDKTPAIQSGVTNNTITTNLPWVAYKALMKNYV